MEHLQTISKMALAGLAVWRLTRTVHASSDGTGAPSYGQPLSPARVRPEDVLGGRVMDFLYWIGIWMSAQTTLWVVCGFSGVLLNWLAFAGIARVVAGVSNPSKELPGTAAVLDKPLTASAAAEEVCNGAAELCL